LKSCPEKGTFSIIKRIYNNIEKVCDFGAGNQGIRI
jgi:hypothetical protein